MVFNQARRLSEGKMLSAEEISDLRRRVAALAITAGGAGGGEGSGGCREDGGGAGGGGGSVDRPRHASREGLREAMREARSPPATSLTHPHGATWNGAAYLPASAPSPPLVVVRGSAWQVLSFTKIRLYYCTSLLLY